ncbi:putative reverse transcriptase domain-containing protein [Tanacetum coccineum]
MKRNIAIYVSKYLTCAKVKDEHQRPSGFLQQLEVPKWKWDKITMDLITKLPRLRNGHDTIWVIVDRLTKSAHFIAIHEDFNIEKLTILYIDVIMARHGVPMSIILDQDGRFTLHFGKRYRKRWGQDLTRVLLIILRRIDKCAPFEALYDRKCRSPVLWVEIGEGSLIGPDLVLETVRIIKSVDYVSPWKGVMRFGKKDKLALRYVGPFKILERTGLVAYRLRLPKELSSVRDTFHVSHLKKCLADANLHVPLDEIKVDKTLHFVKEPVEIMDREIKKLKRRKIALVKVRLNSKCGPEFTWEHKD